MARGDQLKPKTANISHGFRDNLFIPARKVKATRDGVKRNLWEGGLSMFEDVDDTGV
jgi:hypothetical protein